MHKLDASLEKAFTAPICPHCATAYDPKHYDFVEDRACCANCSAHYRLGEQHIPDIPDELLDIADAWPD